MKLVDFNSLDKISLDVVPNDADFLRISTKNFTQFIWNLLKIELEVIYSPSKFQNNL